MENEPEVPEWLTDLDKEILDVLSTELILTPSIIAENIDRSRKGVSNRLTPLQAGELVEKVDRGKYVITQKGLKILSNVDPMGVSGTRRMHVRENARIQSELGISKFEFYERVEEEMEEMQEEYESNVELYEDAFKRVRERILEQKENNSGE